MLRKAIEQQPAGEPDSGLLMDLERRRVLLSRCAAGGNAA